MAVPRGVVTPRESAGRAVSGRRASTPEEAPELFTASRADRDPLDEAAAFGPSPESARAKLGILGMARPAGTAGADVPSAAAVVSEALEEDRKLLKDGIGGMIGAGLESAGAAALDCKADLVKSNSNARERPSTS